MEVNCAKTGRLPPSTTKVGYVVKLLCDAVILTADFL